ncbi:MAG: hypothetical protein Q4C05_06470 [Akkermansia sp.]|nr:hypothetical protein [Akkermansia sp.]
MKLSFVLTLGFFFLAYLVYNPYPRFRAYLPLLGHVDFLKVNNIMSMQIRSFFVYFAVFGSFTGLSSTLIANDFSALFEQPISDNTAKEKSIDPEKQKAFFEALIKAGANVNVEDDFGTPLLHAKMSVVKKSPAIIQMLKNAGAKN